MADADALLELDGARPPVGASRSDSGLEDGPPADDIEAGRAMLPDLIGAAFAGEVNDASPADPIEDVVGREGTARVAREACASVPESCGRQDDDEFALVDDCEEDTLATVQRLTPRAAKPPGEFTDIFSDESL
jgi:hypothetical protein